ncbi:hypothetical protein KGF54_004865 [Candida jiufengensis]|uniref:uncharacterized protein n=1 Tax=Candida jiufengensis TaxID=497108 RepID=UPI002225868D|nr:uncharacterized protein KGF54_004865 [Candida jiufengensis]KAI5951790.1 hypothetical protein KGF54_004865 [Candida jiufengensis]
MAYKLLLKKNLQTLFPILPKVTVPVFENPNRVDGFTPKISLLKDELKINNNVSTVVVDVERGLVKLKSLIIAIGLTQNENIKLQKTDADANRYNLWKDKMTVWVPLEKCLEVARIPFKRTQDQINNSINSLFPLFEDGLQQLATNIIQGYESRPLNILIMNNFVYSQGILFYKVELNGNCTYIARDKNDLIRAREVFILHYGEKYKDPYIRFMSVQSKKTDVKHKVYNYHHPEHFKVDTPFSLLHEVLQFSIEKNIIHLVWPIFSPLIWEEPMIQELTRAIDYNEPAKTHNRISRLPAGYGGFNYISVGGILRSIDGEYFSLAASLNTVDYLDPRQRSEISVEEGQIKEDGTRHYLCDLDKMRELAERYRIPNESVYPALAEKSVFLAFLVKKRVIKLREIEDVEMRAQIKAALDDDLV